MSVCVYEFFFPFLFFPPSSFTGGGDSNLIMICAVYVLGSVLGVAYVTCFHLFSFVCLFIWVKFAWPKSCVAGILLVGGVYSTGKDRGKKWRGRGE